MFRDLEIFAIADKGLWNGILGLVVPEEMDVM